jgi:hypothetical protein
MGPCVRRDDGSDLVSTQIPVATADAHQRGAFRLEIGAMSVWLALMTSAIMKISNQREF